MDTIESIAEELHESGAPEVNPRGGNARETELDQMLEVVQAGSVDPEASPGRSSDKGESQSARESESSESSSEIVDPSDQSPETGEVKAVSLKDLAETLDADVKDLYGVEISIGKDESATLGELKDSYREWKSLKADHEQFETAKAAHGNEVLIATRRIDAIIDAVVQTGAMTPQLAKQLEDHQSDTINRERRLTLKAIPEWSDPITRNTDFDRMVEAGRGHGFSEAEIRNETDSRKLKLMLDYSKMLERSATFKAEPIVPTRLSGKQSTQPVKPTKLADRIAAARASKDHNLKADLQLEVLTNSQR